MSHHVCDSAHGDAGGAPLGGPFDLQGSLAEVLVAFAVLY